MVEVTPTPDPRTLRPVYVSAEDAQMFRDTVDRLREPHVLLPAPRPESLGDKFVRWSEPLERRLKGRRWIISVLSLVVYFAAIAIGCWIQGESFISALTIWR